MDYTPPDLCIRSLVEYKTGYYYLDMPSRFDIEPQPIVEIDELTRETIQDYFKIPMCPPGWPGPIPAEDCMEYHGARVGMVRAEEWCSD